MVSAKRLARIEKVVDASGAAETIEALLPVGPRPRQLTVRSLLIGILIAMSDNRPAHLVAVHRGLLSLSFCDRHRLGVVEWHGSPHVLTYRQVEYTFGRVIAAASSTKTEDGETTAALSSVADSLLEASVPERHKDPSSSLAVDWTDVEAFANPPALRHKSDAVTSADSRASWGHRRGDAPGHKDEVFFGYYLQLATMVADEGGDEVPEVVRRMVLTTCSVDPVPEMVPVLQRLVASGVRLGDVLADSGYAHRVATSWAIPLRMLGANIITDLHPSDRGKQGTFAGAVAFNGNLYCPATPEGLFGLGPLSRAASAAETIDHDEKSAELSRYKFPPITSDDADGYRRVICPAAAGRARCPLKPGSMALPYDRPEVLNPPEHPPTCCDQATITVPPSVNAKTRQKHDYPSAAHRDSYARRTAVERSNSRIKDPATMNISKGFCRLMGLAPLALLVACALVVRNMAVVDAFEERKADNARRAAVGQPPLTRKRRRRSLGDLLTHTTPA